MKNASHALRSRERPDAEAEHTRLWLVGADESAVEHFLNGKISYQGVARVISSVLEEYRGGAPSSLEEAVALVEEGRRAAGEKCKNLSGGIYS